MRKTLKLIAVIFGLFIVLIGVAAGVLSLVIDPNQFKPQLAEMIKEKTGREIEFVGDLRLSFFPGLGFSTGLTRIKNTPAFPENDFLSIEQGEIKVRAMSLLGKNLEISRIELKGVRLNLIRNKEGVNNWSLAEEKSEDSDEPVDPGKESQIRPFYPERTSRIFAVDGISLQDAEISWVDQQAEKRLNIHSINMSVGKFTLDQFADVALRLSIDDPTTQDQDLVDIKTRALIRQNLDQTDFADTQMNWVRKGENIPGKALSAILTAPEIVFEKAAQKIRIDSLHMQSDELSISSSLAANHLFTEVVIEASIKIAGFNPGSLIKRFEITLPKFQDPKAFNRLEASFDLHATQKSLSVKALHCKLDDTLLQGETYLEGIGEPSIRFNLAVDAVDIGRYLSASRSKTKLVSPSAAIAVAFSKLPREQLRKLDAQGEINFRHLTMNGITAEDLRLKLIAKDGVVQTQQDTEHLNRGGYLGSVNVNAKGQDAVIALTEKFENVAIEAFLKEAGSKISMSGSLTGAAALQGQVKNSKLIRESLKGNLAFVLKDGEIKDLKFQKIIQRALTVLNHDPMPTNEGKGIDFTEISGTAALADNVIRSQDLVVKSPHFCVAGSGMTNIDTGLVNYRFVTNLVKTPATATEPEKLHSTPVVVHMTGTLAEPEYQLDMAALLTEKNKAKIEKFLDKHLENKKDKLDKLKEKLDKKLGPKVGDLLKQLF